MRGIGYKQKCPNYGSESVEHLSRITGYVQAVSWWKEGGCRRWRMDGV